MCTEANIGLEQGQVKQTLGDATGQACHLYFKCSFKGNN